MTQSESLHRSLHTDRVRSVSRHPSDSARGSELRPTIRITATLTAFFGDPELGDTFETGYATEIRVYTTREIYCTSAAEQSSCTSTRLYTICSCVFCEASGWAQYNSHSQPSALHDRTTALQSVHTAKMNLCTVTDGSVGRSALCCVVPCSHSGAPCHAVPSWVLRHWADCLLPLSVALRCITCTRSSISDPRTVARTHARGVGRVISVASGAVHQCECHNPCKKEESVGADKPLLHKLKLGLKLELSSQHDRNHDPRVGKVE